MDNCRWRDQTRDYCKIIGKKNEENIHGSSGSGVKERDGNIKDVKRSR